MSSLLKLSCLLLTVAVLSGSVYGSGIPAPLAAPTAGTELSAPADVASLGAVQGTVKGYSDYEYYLDIAGQYQGLYRSTGKILFYAYTYYYYGIAYYYLNRYNYPRYESLSIAWEDYYWADAYYYYFMSSYDSYNAHLYWDYYLAFTWYYYALYVGAYYYDNGDSASSVYYRNMYMQKAYDYWDLFVSEQA